MASSRAAPLTWQRGDDDMHMRSQMIQNIANLLVQRSTNTDPNFLHKVPTIAQRLEERLYRSAVTEQEYADQTTLWNRVQLVSQEFRRTTPTPPGQPELTPSRAPSGGRFPPEQHMRMQSDQQQYMQPPQHSYQGTNAGASQYKPGGVPRGVPPSMTGPSKNPSISTDNTLYSQASSSLSPVYSQSPFDFPPVEPFQGQSSNQQHHQRTPGKQPPSPTARLGPHQYQQSMGGNPPVPNSANRGARQMPPTEIRNESNGRAIPPPPSSQGSRHSEQYPPGFPPALDEISQSAASKQPNGGLYLAPPSSTSAGSSSSFTPAGSSGMSKQHRDKIMQEQQQRLLLLRHASKCQITSGSCPNSPECREMQVLWSHMKECKNSDCAVPHCASMRYFISHYNECKDTRCDVCRPIRESISRNADNLVMQYLNHVKAMKHAKSALEAKKAHLDEAKQAQGKWKDEEARVKAEVKRIDDMLAGAPLTSEVSVQQNALKFKLEHCKTAHKAAKLQVQSIEAEIAADEMVKKDNVAKEARLKDELKGTCGGEAKANEYIRAAVDRHNANSLKLQQQHHHQQQQQQHVGHPPNGGGNMPPPYGGNPQHYPAGAPPSTWNGPLPYGSSDSPHPQAQARLNAVHHQQQQSFPPPPPSTGSGGKGKKAGKKATSAQGHADAGADLAEDGTTTPRASSVAAYPPPYTGAPSNGMHPMVPPPPPSSGSVLNGQRKSGKGSSMGDSLATGESGPPPPPPYPMYHPGASNGQQGPIPSPLTASHRSMSRGGPPPPPPMMMMRPGEEIAPTNRAGDNMYPPYPVPAMRGPPPPVPYTPSPRGMPPHSAPTMNGGGPYAKQPYPPMIPRGFARGPTPLQLERLQRPPELTRAMLDKSYLLWLPRPDIEAHIESMFRFKLKNTGSGNSALAKNFDPTKNFKGVAQQLLRTLMDLPHAHIFKSKVDPEALGIPDYFDRVKHPMDLGTIRSKLESKMNPYRSLAEFAADVRLVYNNAVEYNGVDSEVGAVALEYGQLFEKEYNVFREKEDEVFESARFVEGCCRLCAQSGDFFFEPPVYYCEGAHCEQSKIKRDTVMYVYQDHHLCKPCFMQTLGEMIRIGSDKVSRSAFKKVKNTEEYKEEWITCGWCRRRFHAICAMIKTPINKVQADDYLCPFCALRCLDEKRLDKASQVLGLRIYQNKMMIAVAQKAQMAGSGTSPQVPQSLQNPPQQQQLIPVEVAEPKRTAADLPETPLAKFLEQRVNEQVASLRRSAASEMNLHENDITLPGRLTVRVTLNKHEELMTRETMINLYGGASHSYPKSFPHKQKCLLLFEKIDGVDVLLFIMFLQYYGSDAPAPNKRSLYIAYLDSVNYFTPPGRMRTSVYHELIIGLLEYERRNGYTRCFIWACPPTGGDDYIFNIHPRDQRVPDAAKLRFWYLELLEEARRRGIVVSLNNLFDEYFARVPDVTHVPYFEGDWWQAYGELYIKSFKDKKTNPLALQSKADAARNLGGIKSSRHAMDRERRRKKQQKKGGVGGSSMDVAVGMTSDGGNVILCPPPRPLEQVPLQDMLTAKIAVENERMKREFIVVKMFDECADCGTAMDQPGLIYWLTKSYDPQLDPHQYDVQSYAPPYCLCHECYCKQYEAELGHPLTDFTPPPWPPAEWDNDPSDETLTTSSQSVDQIDAGEPPSQEPDKKKGLLETSQGEKETVSSLVPSSQPLQQSTSSDMPEETMDLAKPGEEATQQDGSRDARQPAEESQDEIMHDEATREAIEDASVCQGDEDKTMKQPEEDDEDDDSSSYDHDKKRYKMERGEFVGTELENTTSMEMEVEGKQAPPPPPESFERESSMMSSFDTPPPSSSSSLKASSSRLLTRTQRRATDSNKMIEELLDFEADGHEGIDIEILEPGKCAKPSNPYTKAPCGMLEMKCVRAMIRPKTVDFDPVQECFIFDTRKQFLSVCQKKKLQFDELRRAKYSTQVLLEMLHDPSSSEDANMDQQFHSMMPSHTTCAGCKVDLMGAERFTCTTCEDFHLCRSCSGRVAHTPGHILEPRGLPTTSGPMSAVQQQQQQRALQVRLAQLNLNLLMHSTTCSDAACRSPECAKMKELIQHASRCPANGQGACDRCHRFFNLVRYHAKSCTNPGCKVIQCNRFKAYLRNQEMMSTDRRVLAMMRAHHHEGGAAPQSAAASASQGGK